VHSRSRSSRWTSRGPTLGLAAIAAAPLLASGCARAVLPSEKAYLADPIMQFGADGLESSADAHVMANREGAAGGTGTAGGGCGCN
jgi:hypothetical protein